MNLKLFGQLNFFKKLCIFGNSAATNFNCYVGVSVRQTITIYVPAANKEKLMFFQSESVPKKGISSGIPTTVILMLVFWPTLGLPICALMPRRRRHSFATL
jgi:hypothetical protein